jgi:ABC-type transporter Mla subunit MlaD
MADRARATVDSLDSGVVTVTIEVQQLFGQVESLVNQVDTEAIASDVKAAIQEFQGRLNQQLATLVSPVREALTVVVASINEKVGAFNPEEIIAALNDVINKLRGCSQLVQPCGGGQGAERHHP